MNNFDRFCLATIAMTIVDTLGGLAGVAIYGPGVLYLYVPTAVLTAIYVIGTCVMDDRAESQRLALLVPAIP